MTSWQLQPPQQQCSAQRQPRALPSHLHLQPRVSSVHRLLFQHRRPHRSLEALPARFTNCDHVAYYGPPVASSKKEKIRSHIKVQKRRLKELQRESAERTGEVSRTEWSHLVHELQDLSGSLSDVAKMAASSSSSSDSETSGKGAVGAKHKGRALPQLPALAQLARTAGGAPAAVPAAAAPAAQQRESDAASAASPASAVGSDAAPRAAAGAHRPAGSPAASPAAAEPELASVLRLHEHRNATLSAGAALLGAAATSLAAGRDAGRERDATQRRLADPGALASNIVAAPQTAARVQVCQGKSCTKRGAADLLLQASAAGAGQPGVEVSGCKCLGECKRGPAVRVRTGRERPTVLTEVTTDGGTQLASLMERAMLRAERTALEQPQDAADVQHPEPQEQLLRY